MSLTREDWIEAGLAALARDGLAGVAVEPLARRLGATKGSFYWHFAGRDALIAATLERWEQRETAEVIERIRALDDPRQRLAALGRAAYAGAGPGNAHAAVLASASHPRVRPVLRRVTHARLLFLAQLYGDLGVPPDAAPRWARLAYALYLGIGELRRAGPEAGPDGRELDAYLDLAVDRMIPGQAGASPQCCLSPPE